MTLLIGKRKTKHYIKILFYFKIKIFKNSLKVLKVVLKKIPKLLQIITKKYNMFEFFFNKKKLKLKLSCFSWCFHMESPRWEGINDV